VVLFFLKLILNAEIDEGVEGLVLLFVIFGSFMKKININVISPRALTISLLKKSTQLCASELSVQ